jgi:predicted metal-dependent enzyme (double-stranded beta helix superfamily)
VFIDLIRALAGRGIHNQKAYVEQVGSLVRRLNVSDPVILTALANAERHYLLNPEFLQLFAEPAFEVVSIAFDKGQIIPPHNHPDMTGVTGCISGSVWVDSYEPTYSEKPNGPLLFKQTASRRLTYGSVSTLTAEMANIHCLRAYERTQIIDIFTPPYDADRRQRTKWYRLKVTKPGGNIFAATPMV